MSGIERLKELINNPECRKFISDNLKKDVPGLMLKHAQDADYRLLLQQIAARQRARKKLPEWYGNYELLFPPAENLEQSSSELTARFKAEHFQGNTFADLTAGFGVDAYYLGLSFAKRIINEPAAELRTILDHNFQKLNFEAAIKGKSAEEGLNELGKQDLIYLDPSRRSADKGRVYNIEDYDPDLFALQPSLIAKAKNVLVKVSPMVSLYEIQRKLNTLTEAWVVAVRNEVKEVLLLLCGSTDGGTRIRTWNLHDLENYQYFELSAGSAKPKLEISRPGKWIYEPNTAIFKAGIMDEAGNQFHLQKLHPQSHFYTSDSLHQGFPGRIYELQSIHKQKDPALKKGRYNVVARNYPLNAREIEKRLQLKPAKYDFLLATTLSDGSSNLLITKLYQP